MTPDRKPKLTPEELEAKAGAFHAHVDRLLKVAKQDKEFAEIDRFVEQQSTNDAIRERRKGYPWEGSW